MKALAVPVCLVACLLLLPSHSSLRCCLTCPHRQLAAPCQAPQLPGRRRRHLLLLRQPPASWATCCALPARSLSSDACYPRRRSSYGQQHRLEKPLQLLAAAGAGTVCGSPDRDGQCLKVPDPCSRSTWLLCLKRHWSGQQVLPEKLCAHSVLSSPIIRAPCRRLQCLLAFGPWRRGWQLWHPIASLASGRASVAAVLAATAASGCSVMQSPPRMRPALSTPSPWWPQARASSRWAPGLLAPGV